MTLGPGYRPDRGRCSPRQPAGAPSRTRPVLAVCQPRFPVCGCPVQHSRADLWRGNNSAQARKTHASPGSFP